MGVYTRVQSFPMIKSAIKNTATGRKTKKNRLGLNQPGLITDMGYRVMIMCSDMYVRPSHGCNMEKSVCSGKKPAAARTGTRARPPQIEEPIMRSLRERSVPLAGKRNNSRVPIRQTVASTVAAIRANT